MKTELKNTMLVWRQGLYFSIVKSKSLNCEAFFGEWKPLQYDDRRYPTWKQESMEQRLNILREKTFPQKDKKEHKHKVTEHQSIHGERGRREHWSVLPFLPNRLQNPHKRRKPVVACSPSCHCGSWDADVEFSWQGLGWQASLREGVTRVGARHYQTGR